MKEKSMSELDKEQFEMDTIVAAFQDIPISKNHIKKQSPPEPDFVVENLQIGVELTSYIKDKKSNLEGNIFTYINNCKKLYESSGGTKSAYFFLQERFVDNFKMMDKETKLETQNIIVSYAKQHENRPFEDSVPDEVKSICSDIDLFDDPYQNEPLWQWIRAGFINYETQVIQEIIANKDKKILNYGKTYDQIWLLIHSTSGCCVGVKNRRNSFATCAKFDKSKKEYSFDTCFDKVFFFDFEGKLYELQTANLSLSNKKF